KSADFAQRKTRVVVVSVEGPEAAQKTQADFPHLVVVSDVSRGLTGVADVIHPDSNPNGGDTAAPGTLLIDRHGTVRWPFRAVSGHLVSAEGRRCVKPFVAIDPNRARA